MLSILYRMKAPERVDRSSRAAAKQVSRRADRARLEQGEKPEVLQEQNSIFPKDFFKKARISNLGQAVGR